MREVKCSGFSSERNMRVSSSISRLSIRPRPRNGKGNTAYHRLLTAVTPHLRVIARKRCEQFGAPASEAEDVVQKVLLAIHLKRGT